ncbi:glycoside hydrolase family 2 protein [Neorhizobium petrolearium]|uniref:beta-mannosidase n=1 Tax=Neorhizobium petrolearium TaxID=515361 RepID=A0ABY8M1J4_9HYPH|nr:glycoside hydrolase family 2 protein [Neorhizobium petrolearium]MCC2612699.1 glycoside hydrolase family 2 protein [Neorhizobium petrolearium]WGI67821.1 glycoside hydrolase family 2 protein [Neorhizobium petrolearium]
MSTLSLIGAETSLLDEGWSLVVTEPGAHTLPGELPFMFDDIPAIVPGTAAAALEATGRFDRDNPAPLFDKDIWYRRSLAGETPGPVILRFAGLATVAEVFLDDRLILSSQSMFESHDVPANLAGCETLSICFRALKPHLEKSGPRARWRPRLMNNQGLRLIRTTALGFMPGWCPDVQAVGPWRPVSLIRPGRTRISDLGFSAGLRDGEGVLKVSFAYEGLAHNFRLVCDGREASFVFAEGKYSAELRLPGIKPWWPHTHGEPNLYDIVLRIDGERFPLARTGFRTVSVDRGEDGNDFALIVNGEKIFCRGAVWTSADIVKLPGDRESYEPWLRLAKDAGMNMIRIPGIATYESPDFFALCDELGLMVWQDFMFANFDYPAADPDFVIHVKKEVEQFLYSTQASPSLAVLCGGSEIYQQGAMLGLPGRIWKGLLCEETLAGLAGKHRPDLPYVANSPSGGALPFFPNAGVAHYYGVGAYKRPLEDARRANVRFAAECLAFSNLSATETLQGSKAGIPRDAGADWDFEDVRDHYLCELYGVDPQKLRCDDFDRYLALSRAVTGEVMEATFAEWRRPGSTCDGALIFTFQDVMRGPGWGVVGADGKPKPAWHALKRAFRPVQIMFTDEGTSGLDLHLLNETAYTLPVVLEVTCLRDGKMPVVSGRRELTLPARGSESLACVDLFGAFSDANYAYRFGPPSHDVTVARLKHAETSELIAEAFHFPLGRANALHDAGISVSLEEDDGAFWLQLSTDCFAQSVSIDALGCRPGDNWFHLAPNAPKRVQLEALPGATGRPGGTVRSLGSNRVARF